MTSLAILSLPTHAVACPLPPVLVVAGAGAAATTGSGSGGDGALGRLEQSLSPLERSIANMVSPVLEVASTP